MRTRIESIDAATARTDDGLWVRRATFRVVRGSDRELVARWTSPMRIVQFTLDGQRLVVPTATTDRLSVVLPDDAASHVLDLVWVSVVDDDLPPTGPDIPRLSVDGTALPAGPVLWTIHAPPGSLPSADVPPLAVESATFTAQRPQPLAFVDAFTRGMSLTWSIPPGARGPRLTWPAPDWSWPPLLLRTALIAVLGVLGVWWSRWVGAGGWPEQLMVLALAAWAAGIGPLWLVPAAMGMGARVWLVGRAVLRRWWVSVSRHFARA
jgi:hypothetical protein